MAFIAHAHESVISMVAAAGIAPFDIVGENLDKYLDRGAESSGDTSFQGHYIGF